MEVEKEKICSVIDYQKLTVEGCIHAAQNERLPLRAVVQVLFLEQLQLRQVINGTLVTAVTEEDGDETDGGEGEVVEFGRWKKMVRENQVLRLDMDTMRTRVKQLEKECSDLKKVIKKIDEDSLSEVNDGTRKWSIGKKFGCKFTMVDQRSRHS